MSRRRNRVADEVMRMPDPQVQRQDEEEEETLETKINTSKTLEANPDLESGIQALKGGGQPVPKSVRASFETHFGRDFGNVRIHTDTKAVDLARDLSAQAFTVGRDVVFGAEQYAPSTSVGKRLLAHELTHVAQQLGDQAQVKPAKTHLLPLGRENIGTTRLIHRQATPFPEMEVTILRPGLSQIGWHWGTPYHEWLVKEGFYEVGGYSGFISDRDFEPDEPNIWARDPETWKWYQVFLDEEYTLMFLDSLYEHPDGRKAEIATEYWPERTVRTVTIYESNRVTILYRRKRIEW